jgi:hypothetical protein
MSEAGSEGGSYIEAHRAEAIALGEQVAELTEQPEVFVSTLQGGLAGLVDPNYVESTRRVSPDVPADLAVRGPLVSLIERPVSKALREGSSSSALMLGQRLAQSEQREMRMFVLPCLRRSLADDPELTWQLMRRLGRGAGDWIEVDALADVWARGVLAESFRWAELEQLVYSLQTMERRLVGATLATLPHRVPIAERASLSGNASERAMALLRLLMGDAEVMVQKALSWAIREWSRVDMDASTAFLSEETAIAVERADGARAWVIRDALSHQSDAVANELRGRLAGIRRHKNAPSTSIATAQSATFAAALSESSKTVAHQGDRYTRSRP